MTRFKYIGTPNTYRDTKFATWRKRLNAELTRRGLPEYEEGAALDAYKMGVTPSMEATEAEHRKAL